MDRRGLLEKMLANQALGEVWHACRSGIGVGRGPRSMWGKDFVAEAEVR